MSCLYALADRIPPFDKEFFLKSRINVGRDALRRSAPRQKQSLTAEMGLAGPTCKDSIGLGNDGLLGPIYFSCNHRNCLHGAVYGKEEAKKPEQVVNLLRQGTYRKEMSGISWNQF